MAKRWYVIQTKAGQEQQAVQEIKNQNFKVFYPTYVYTRKTSKKKIVQRIMPLFPSYLFVQFDVKRNRRWKALASTRGVQRLVGYTDTHLSPVAPGCIEELIARIDAKGHIQLEESVAQILEFTPNMQLEVRNEAYKGLVGTYCSNTQKRVTLLLSLLGREIKVTLPVSAVRPVTK